MTHNKIDIKLRATEVSDLNVLFQFQQDKASGYLAAFMPKDPTDKPAFLNKYIKLLDDPTVNNQTIIFDNTIVEAISKMAFINLA
ncbi:MAG: hypothetical protein U0U46_08060 [Saprospiraceae bacterium]